MSPRGAVLEGGESGERLLSLLVGSGPGVEYFLQHGTALKTDAKGQSWLVDVEGRRCFARFYRHKSPLRRVFPAATARRPRLAFRAGKALHDLGLAVARPLCCVAVAGGVLLLTEALPCSDHLAGQWPTLLPARRQSCLVAAAHSLAALHAQGYSHGDCKWHNLVMVHDTCFFVDLDRALHSGGDSRRRARDIARFTVSAEEAGVGQGLFGVFLDAYRSRADWCDSAFMATLAGEAQRLRRRHERRYGITARPLL